jgi:hypothetical protein
MIVINVVHRLLASLDSRRLSDPKVRAPNLESRLRSGSELFESRFAKLRLEVLEFIDNISCDK